MEASQLQDIHHYLDFMLGDDQVFCAVWFDSLTNQPIYGYGKGKHGTLPEFIHDYEHFVAEGKLPTLHITLNQLAIGHERASGKWESCRCICVDIDTPTTALLLKQYIQAGKPHMVVASSPNKYHLYWKLQPGFGGKYWQDIWCKVQAAFNYQMSGDLSMRSVAKIIRMPGFYRKTKSNELFLPHILWTAHNPMPLTYDYIQSLPWFNSVSESVDHLYKKQHQLITRDVLKHINSAASSSDANRYALNKKVPVGDRNTTLYKYVYAYVKAKNCTTDEAAQYAKAILSQFEISYPMHEALPTINSAFNSAKNALARAREKALRVLSQADNNAIVEGPAPVIQSIG